MNDVLNFNLYNLLISKLFVVIRMFIESFFDNIDRIGKVNYMPTEKDILFSKVKTTGIVETEFEINNRKFRYLILFVKII